jgi:hypothetical protein
MTVWQNVTGRRILLIVSVARTECELPTRTVARGQRTHGGAIPDGIGFGEMNFKGDITDRELVAVLQQAVSQYPSPIDIRTVPASHIADTDVPFLRIDNNSAMVSADAVSRDADVTVGSPSNQEFRLNPRIVWSLQNKWSRLIVIDPFEDDVHDCSPVGPLCLQTCL